MGISRPQMAPALRRRRFWRAHGRTFKHLAVLRVLTIHPTVTWSPGRLCAWYGFRIDSATELLREFASCGIVRKVEGLEERYVWNQELRWAIPMGMARCGLLT